MDREESAGPPRGRPKKAPKGRKLLPLVVVIVLVLGGVGGLGAYLFFSSRGGVGHVNIYYADTKVTDIKLDQGSLTVLNASAFDSSGVDVTKDKDIAFEWTATPASAAKITPSQVSSTAQIRALEAGAATITATAKWHGASGKAQLAMTVTALSFEIRASNQEPVLGQPILLTVTAVRTEVKTEKDHMATSYRGKITFTASDPSAASLPDTTLPFSAAGAGSHSFDGLKMLKAGQFTITARDTVAAITGSIKIFGDRVPVPSFTITTDPSNLNKITVDGSTSQDPDKADLGDSITSYGWTFGDGSEATGQTAAHTYATWGQYAVNLTLSDTHHGTAVARQIYRVKVPPMATFDITDSVADPDGSVLFYVDGSGSIDPDGHVVSYSWTWKNGTLEEQTSSPTTTHLYAANLKDTLVTIGLRAIDEDGLSSARSEKFNVKVTSDKYPPVASFTIPLPFDALNRTLTVDATPSSDPNGNIANYSWDWGDGSWTNGSRNPISTHTYDRDGDYTIILTVGDTTHLESTFEIASFHVEQPQVPPTAHLALNRHLLHVDANASASFDYNRDITTYQWNWGDGATTSGSSPIAGHDYSAGKYVLQLTVIDSRGHSDSRTQTVSVGPSTIDHQFYDFFNVPYKEYWDIRRSFYGADHPVGAECFNQTGINDLLCQPKDPNVPDLEKYPYTDWYALPGPTNYTDLTNNAFIYAPYRWRATGVNVPGYNLSEPVFLPVLNYGQEPGARLDFDWQMHYLDYAESDYLYNMLLCPGMRRNSNDGYFARSTITLTMDLQESKRIFNVANNVTTQGDAQWWWGRNVNSKCYLTGPVELAVQNWFVKMGGSQTTVGKYDIENGYEWWYAPFYVQIAATVDADGTTHVTIDTTAWGTEVLFGRFMYWGNTSYAQNYMDSSKARGWSGMEVAWFEDVSFKGSLTPNSMDFAFNTVMEYHFQQICTPGLNGLYDRVDDGVTWTWGPWLNDYMNDFSPTHLASEVDRYNGPDGNYNTPDDITYIHCTPGVYSYGKSLSYDYIPISWDLRPGETWHFQFPTGKVVFYDPNLSPLPSKPTGDPTVNGFIASYKPLVLQSTQPNPYGVWEPVAMTWDVVGPSQTGGPNGTPGHYPVDPWGSITFGPG